MPLPDIDSARTWGADAWNDAEPSVDPSTELSADTAKEIAADVAASTHTQPRALVRFQCKAYAGTPEAMFLVDHDAVWGSIAPVAPTVTQSAPGRYTVMWNPTATDELGNTHTLNCRFPRQPTVIGPTDGRVRILWFSVRSVILQTYLMTGAEDSLEGDTIVVEW